VTFLLLSFAVYFTIYKPFIKNRTILNVLSLSSNIYEDSKYLVEDNSLYGNSEAREQFADLVKKTVLVSPVSAQIKKTFLDLALVGINKDLIEDPFNPRPPFFGAMLYESFGDKENASKMYEENLKRAPSKPIFMASYAEFLLSQKDYKKAEEVATSAFALTNRSFQNALILATIYEVQKQEGKSYETMDKYIKSNKNDLKAFVNVVLFFKKQNSGENLKKIIKELILLYPETEREIKEFVASIPKSKK
jgi:tetratricopeptide (TPR) repeat protein